MAARSPYEELAGHLGAVAAVKRGLTRSLPDDCPAGSTAVLALLGKHGEMRLSRLADLLAVDMSVTSRHVAHAAGRGWLERHPDPLDGRSRLLRLSPAGTRILAEVSERWTEMLASRLADWDVSEIEQLNTLLTRLRTSFGDCHPRAHHDRTTTRTDA
ncbi:MarR family winged helix-turn-helix transcriptional regulator [Streptomyces meridianus]|uniref:MarR family winged helix-turn-helix transcriptional regulator n=1 Tax=Streptomyces meridianus TaxID=2938945 RepID=A0ABT0XCC7_9ACTN|nr:MarR family winged helix-turn-helix transcriptional regulator [Streptomyces meridianus]MCM2580161.1 MarR family winged helix-turn-helix transcriptional regulator [Streptomyces meridianus]